MKVQLAAILVILGFYSLAQGQSALPGIEQWQSYMRQHAVAEGRPGTQITQDKQRGLWQSQIDKVRNQEQELSSKVSVSQTRIEETFDNNQDQKKIKKILKKIRERTQDRTRKPAVFEVGREEQLDQDEINNILTEKIGTKTGLKEIIKQLIRNKLEEPQGERSPDSPLDQLIQSSQYSVESSQGSTIEELLESNGRRQFSEKPIERPVSFLDKLSAIYVPTTEAQEYIESYDDYEEKMVPEEEYERGLESLFSSDYPELDSLIESDRSSLVDLFGAPDVDENRLKIEIDSLEDEDFYTTEEDIAKDFLADEINSAQSETEQLVDEMEKMLVVLEAEANSDSKLVEKTLTVIKSKLRSSSIQDLLGDTDFKNSVFYRFAIMKLPLREEDIPVAELSEIKKVIRSNIVTAIEETKELLKELKRDITAQNTDNEEERPKTIDDARRQLQKLLEIVSPSV